VQADKTTTSPTTTKFSTQSNSTTTSPSTHITISDDDNDRCDSSDGPKHYVKCLVIQYLSDFLVTKSQVPYAQYKKRFLHLLHQFKNLTTIIGQAAEIATVVIDESEDNYIVETLITQVVDNLKYLMESYGFSLITFF